MKNLNIILIKDQIEDIAKSKLLDERTRDKHLAKLLVWVDRLKAQTDYTLWKPENKETINE